ncbi:MAG: hypothetical protein HY875_12595 [Chloroflexi bacterium]|nr:hypothetical protein [Chloroflexota bacterium]
MRTLCLYLPRLATSLAVRQRPQAEGLPVALLAGTGADALVSAVSSEAAAAGLIPGMAAGEARRRCPNAAFLPDNAAASLDEIERLAGIVATYATPLVAAGGRDHLFVSLDGLEARFGDESTAAARIATRARAWAGSDVRAGVGSSRALALRAARCAHRYPLVDDQAADAEPPLPAFRAAPESLTASTKLPAPLAVEHLDTALGAFARRTDILLGGRSFRRVEVEVTTPEGTFALRAAPLQPLHSVAEALALVGPRLSAAAGVTEAKAVRLTLGALAPDVRVRGGAPMAAARMSRAAEPPPVRRARQMLLRAAS